LETQKAQIIGNYWSAINQTQDWEIFIEIATNVKGFCQLKIALRHGQNEIILVSFSQD
jgi:hypothetical protein